MEMLINFFYIFNKLDLIAFIINNNNIFFTNVFGNKFEISFIFDFCLIWPAS